MNPHESARLHVSGEAVFINDRPEEAGMLHGYVLYSSQAHAEIVSIDVSAALTMEGVAAVLCAEDIPGSNQLGPVVHDEPCLATAKVNCVGQAVALIAAASPFLAFKAAQAVRIEYAPLPACLSIVEAIQMNNALCEPVAIACGNSRLAMQSAEFVLKGEVRSGAQEHWYLETQTAVAIPGEDQTMQIWASTQHPAETQAIVAEVLGIERHKVQVNIKRMGGAFGGKETQGNHVAAWASLLAHKTKKPVKIHLSRDDDQKITGKRHRFYSTWTIGFDAQGKIQAFEADLHADAGIATDLSRAILDRALFHTDSACFVPHFRVTGHLWKTNLPSNTAFRGFGGPQGMLVMEHALDQVARFLKMDPIALHMLNYYREAPFNSTPYGQLIEASPLKKLTEDLISRADYSKRRQAIEAFNLKHSYVKRGLGFMPVKFGISFTTSFLNQAAALVNIYQDGSVLLHHGGTEMGQGLHTKILEIAAKMLGIPVSRFRVDTTNTSILPNTSATAASSGSDLNGMAVKHAIEQVKQRLSACLCREWEIPEQILEFKDGKLLLPAHPEKSVPFEYAVKRAYLNRVSLSAGGFYHTPGLTFDPKTRQGKAFHYFVNSLAISEVECDMLTGSIKVLRADILHEGGNSLHPEIDKGQILGGFIQGLGWVSTEVVGWDTKGNLMHHSPDTYKIPTIADIPEILNLHTVPCDPLPETIFSSKAVGEPPFMLALSVWLAIRDSLSDLVEFQQFDTAELPLTYEHIVKLFHRGYFGSAPKKINV